MEENVCYLTGKNALVGIENEVGLKSAERFLNAELSRKADMEIYEKAESIILNNASLKKNQHSFTVIQNSQTSNYLTKEPIKTEVYRFCIFVLHYERTKFLEQIQYFFKPWKVVLKKDRSIQGPIFGQNGAGYSRMRQR